MAAMLPVPKVFIGSSHEGRDVAYAIQHHLEGRIAETTVWDQGLFNLSNTSISSLVDIMHRFDFAIFAMCADDITVLRGERVVTARDNVIFELGLAISGMGLDKTYMVVPDGIIDFHLPTDLLGLIYARYNSHRSDGNLRAALGPACSLIEDEDSRATIRGNGARQTVFPLLIRVRYATSIHRAVLNFYSLNLTKEEGFFQMEKLAKTIHKKWQTVTHMTKLGCTVP